MAFICEVTVVQIREAFRRWLNGDGERTIAKAAGVDRKTARCRIGAGRPAGRTTTMRVDDPLPGTECLCTCFMTASVGSCRPMAVDRVAVPSS